MPAASVETRLPEERDFKVELLDSTATQLLPPLATHVCAMFVSFFAMLFKVQSETKEHTLQQPKEFRLKVTVVAQLHLLIC